MTKTQRLAVTELGKTALGAFVIRGVLQDGAHFAATLLAVSAAGSDQQRVWTDRGVFDTGLNVYELYERWQE